MARGPARRLDVLVFTNFLALGIIIAAVPRYLHGELHATRFQTGAATTSYFLAALLVRPFIGAWVDRFGRRPFLIVPPSVVGLLTLLYVRVHSVLGVAELRLAAGGMAALFFTSVALAATDLAAPEGRTKALGRQSVMTYGAFTVGPIIADQLLDHGWSLVWVVPALLHFVTTIAALGMSETRVSSNASTATIGFDRRVLRPAVALLVANFSFSTLVAFIPEYSERMAITRPGWLFSTYAIAVLTVRALTGSVADRIGPARFTVPTLAIGAFGLAGLAMAQQQWQSFVAIAVVGMSLGSTFPAATAASLLRVGAEDRGKAMGTALALGDIGQAVAGPLVGYLTTSIGFRWVFVIPAVLAVAGVVVLAGMPEVRTGVSAGGPARQRCIGGEPSLAHDEARRRH